MSVEETITPLAYGLLNTSTVKLLTTHVYVSEAAAKAGAERMTNQYRTFVAIPLFGPDAYATMKQALEASQHAESMLRGEAIRLRNQLAPLKGEAMAKAHAAGLPYRSDP
jgi:hypothetical protein